MKTSLDGYYNVTSGTFVYWHSLVLSYLSPEQTSSGQWKSQQYCILHVQYGAEARARTASRRHLLQMSQTDPVAVLGSNV
jgi:hypothetical protein